MQRPTRANLTELHGLSAEEYSAWLLEGFYDQANGGEGVYPFGQAWAFIGGSHNDHISEDLCDIFAVLNPKEREEFCKGIAIAIHALDFSNSEDIRLAQDIMRLAGHAQGVMGQPIAPYLPGVPDKIALAHSLLDKTETGKTVLLLARELFAPASAERPATVKAKPVAGATDDLAKS